MAAACAEQKPSEQRDPKMVECVGPRYWRFRMKLKLVLPITNQVSSAQASNESEIETSELDDTAFLRSLNPKYWKNQDHYAVLGIGNLRYKATEEEIRSAHRKRMLLHHPDKITNGNNEEDDYFTCITRAWEILGHPERRRMYDSVDPFFDARIPKTSPSPENFFNVFGDVFKSNARWSNIQPVPELGDENSTKSEVDRFYNFWFDFQSWREFSYQYYDPAMMDTDREERRYIMRDIKAKTMKEKKAETARIRNLVQLAYASDPRMAKFREESKEKKLAAKQARLDEKKAIRLKEEQLAKEAFERECLAKEEEEAKLKRELEEKKAAENRVKRAVKRLKNSITTSCQQHNYFLEDGMDIISRVALLEEMIHSLDLEELKEFHDMLQSDGKTFFESKVKEFAAEKEKAANLTLDANQQKETDKEKKREWSQKDMCLLVKAVNTYPAGLDDRWELICNFLETHSKSGVKRTLNETMARVKELQLMKIRIAPETQVKCYDVLDKKGNLATSEPPRVEEAGSGKCEPEIREWTNNEQKLLEQALKKYPGNVEDRWGKISAYIGSRTKEEALARCKELIESIKAKKK